jgi:dephospho-CoA kinase
VALHVFGLTGGIGSGKSTVGRLFRRAGLPVVDADELAREAVAPGSPGLAALRARFGDAFLLPDGSLDRAKLGAHVFGNKPELARLNAIVHPEVRRLSEQRFAELRARGEELACYEVPLLFEVGLEESFRPVVVVESREEQQRQRIAERDGATLEHIQARLAAQLPLSEKVRRADIVIDNRGTLEELHAEAARALRAVCERVGVSPERYRIT